MSRYLVVKGTGPTWTYRANTLKEVKKITDKLNKVYGKSKVQVYKKLVNP